MLRRRPVHRHEIPGNRVTVFRDGDATFAAMLKAIDQAEKHVCLETYILRDDATGWEFATKLADRASQGVEVNVMYDGFGSMGLGETYIEYLMGKGVRLCEYHPILPWRKGFDLNRRNHRKQLIVDGRIGFLGGINIADEYRSMAAPAWRDTHVCVEGPAVERMLKLFMRTWARHGGERMHRDRYRGTAPWVGDTRVEVLGNRHHADRGAIRRAYLQAFQTAREQILITNSYFVPDNDIRRALTAAAKRGVRVALILAGKSDVVFLQLASRHFYQELLASGVELYEWNRTVLHAKTAVVDEDWSTVGSYNLNWRSHFHNLECNLVIHDKATALALEKMFWDDVQLSQIVDMHFIESLGTLQKLAGQVVAQFRYWL